jgi:hypothetical protein
VATDSVGAFVGLVGALVGFVGALVGLVGALVARTGAAVGDVVGALVLPHPSSGIGCAFASHATHVQMLFAVLVVVAPERS